MLFSLSSMIGIPVFNFKKKVLIIMIGFNTSNTSYTDLVPGCVDNQILKNKSTLVRAFWWLSGEESACNAGATEDMGLIPESGRSPGGGHGIPLQYSCPENSKDRGAWWATVHRVTELDTTEATWHAHYTCQCRPCVSGITLSWSVSLAKK